MEEKILKEKSLRITPFRKEVLQVFIENEHAVSTQDIEKALGEHDRITLYRTIKSFINKGVIHEIVMPGDVKKMALCDPVCSHDDGLHEHNHIHFQCKKCEEVYCVEVEKLPNLTLQDFQIDEIEIQARGTCKVCFNKQVST